MIPQITIYSRGSIIQTTKTLYIQNYPTLESFHNILIL